VPKKIISLFVIFILPLTAVCEQKTFRLGVIQSLSGIAAEDGHSALNGIQLAVDKINSATPGAIELLVEDDQTSPKVTVSAYDRLAAKNAAAIIGPTWDFLVRAIIPKIGQGKIPVISATMPHETVDAAAAQGRIFFTGTSVAAEAEAYKQYLKERHPSSAVILYPSNGWGEVQEQVYRKISEDNGVKIVGSHKNSDISGGEWETVLPRVKAEKAELILLLLNKDDISLIAKRLTELEIKSALFSSRNGFAAASDKANLRYLEDICFTYPLKELEGNKDFIEQYKTRYNTAPLQYTDSAYDSVFLLHDAFLCGSREHRPISDCLRNTSFNGVQGQYKYSEKNSLSIGSSSLVCIKDGKLVS
jgi:branched-chain amino acid transport system substrate-binding protein